MKKTVTDSVELLTFLKEIFTNTSTNKLRKMLTTGRVTVNNTVIHKAKHILVQNDVVEIGDKTTKSPTTSTNIPIKNLKINLIYEDEYILVVEKPPKVLSVATDKLESETLHAKCVDYLKQTDPNAWAYIVHRLDKETSGVMLLAKHKSAKNYLQEQFAERAVYRIYHALIEGVPEEELGTVKQYLLEDKNLNIKTTTKSHKDAKLAITHWEVLSTNNNSSIVRVMIETGRRHQIRMAMKSLGHPIVGDLIHGAETDPFSRICLHATSLEFLHPQTDEPVRFESSQPFTTL